MNTQDQKDQEIFECLGCQSPLRQEDEFCPECGSLFEEDLKCSVHSDKEAEGVCIICCLPFCDQCSGIVSGRFLCHTHSGYEIYQGMARVYGDLDDTNAQYKILPGTGGNASICFQ